MTKLNVLNKKNNVEGIAVELENGRFSIEENGSTKEVAGSTFKRWYKVVTEVLAPVQNELELLLEGATEVEVAVEEEVQTSAVKEVVEVEVGKSQQVATRGGKCEKVITTLAFNNVNVTITEYNGYVCDVVLTNPETNEVEYKSPKMSIKDTLEHMGFQGEELKAARKQLMALKKLAKQAI